MAANYERPKPIDTIHYRRECLFRVQCPCGHSVTANLGKFAAERGIAPSTRIYRVIERLRCSRCGCRPNAEVTLY